jgi:hypothetical protein
MTRSSYGISILMISSSITALLCFLSLAFGMERLSSPTFPLGGALFLFETMGGAFLLLASGARVVASRLSTQQFFAIFTAAVIIVGLVLTRGQHELVDWIGMTVAVDLAALATRRSWIWGLLGGLWAGLFLAILSVLSILDFFSPATSGVLPEWLPFWFLGCILAFFLFNIVVPKTFEANRLIECRSGR